MKTLLTILAVVALVATFSFSSAPDVQSLSTDQMARFIGGGCDCEPETPDIGNAGPYCDSVCHDNGNGTSQRFKENSLTWKTIYCQHEDAVAGQTCSNSESFACGSSDFPEDYKLYQNNNCAGSPSLISSYGTVLAYASGYEFCP